MRRIVPAALGAAIVSLVVAGCAAGSIAQQARGVTIMVEGSRPSGVMEALISGTLTVTEGGCFAVAAGGVTYPLQFPFGTRLSDDGTEVAVPGLPALRVGDEISGGGGYLHLTDVDPACAAENEYEEYAIWQTVAG